jgi:hypothetical protein
MLEGVGRAPEAAGRRQVGGGGEEEEEGEGKDWLAAAQRLMEGGGGPGSPVRAPPARPWPRVGRLAGERALASRCPNQAGWYSNGGGGLAARVFGRWNGAIYIII